MSFKCLSTSMSTNNMVIGMNVLMAQQGEALIGFQSLNPVEGRWIKDKVRVRRMNHRAQ